MIFDVSMIQRTNFIYYTSYCTNLFINLLFTVANKICSFIYCLQRDDVFVKQLPKQEVLVTREILIELKDVSVSYFYK